MSQKTAIIQALSILIPTAAILTVRMTQILARRIWMETIQRTLIQTTLTARRAET